MPQDENTIQTDELEEGQAFDLDRPPSEEAPVPTGVDDIVEAAGGVPEEHEPQPPIKSDLPEVEDEQEEFKPEEGPEVEEAAEEAEVVGEEAPEVEAPPDQEAETQEEVVAEDQGSNVDELLAIIESQAQENQRLQFGLPKQDQLAGYQKPAEPEPEAAPVQVEPPVQMRPITEPIQYVDEQIHVDAINDPKVFNEVLSRVKADVIETMLRSLPQVINPYVAQHVTIIDAAKDFYEAFPHLAKCKTYVGQVADSLQSEHPDWTVEQIFQNLGEEVNSKLKLFSKQSAGVIPPKSGKPAGVPRVRGGRRMPKRTEPDENDVSAELAKLER